MSVAVGVGSGGSGGVVGCISGGIDGRGMVGTGKRWRDKVGWMPELDGEIWVVVVVSCRYVDMA